MQITKWLIAGGIAGLLAGIALEVIVGPDLPATRWVQLVLVLFGAAVAAWVYESAKAVTQGREPTRSTDRPRRFARRSR